MLSYVRHSVGKKLNSIKYFLLMYYVVYGNFSLRKRLQRRLLFWIVMVFVYLKNDLKFLTSGLHLSYYASVPTSQLRRSYWQCLEYHLDF